MTVIRQPFAQNFYPGNCRKQIDNFIMNFSLLPGLPRHLIGAILPHAGWIYSGAVAARTFFTLSRRSKPETCVVFGTDHTGVSNHAVYPDGTWDTPLGQLPIDEELVAKIYAALPEQILLSKRVHAQEHSIEVLTPMIRYFWPHIHMVPIIVKPEISAIELGKVVSEQVGECGKSVVFFASSDLTHYGSLYGNIPAGTGRKGFAWMKANDRRMTRRLCAMKTDQILSEAKTHHNACGPGALVALLSILADYGVIKGNLVQYATSHGDQSDDYFTTGVGYAGIVY